MEWGETDAAGIVFYPNYFRWFDQAAHELFRWLGHPVAALMETEIAIPIIDCGARFLTPLRYDDEVDITSAIVSVRTRAFRVEHTIRREGSVVCEGHEVRMWVRCAAEPAQLQPEPIPPEIRSAMLGTSSAGI